MAAPTQPLFSFGLFADAQYANKPNDLVKKKFYKFRALSLSLCSSIFVQN
jgi:hypothetical protein